MANACFMVEEMTLGGGNAITKQKMVVRRTAAIGDVIASLCVADKLIEKGYSVEFQAHPSIHTLLRRHGKLSAIKEPNGYCTINLDNAYENHAERRTRHFSDIFLSSANSQLSKYGINIGEPINCTPTLRVPNLVKEVSASLFAKHAKPWVFVCPRSHNYHSRTVGDQTWQEAAAKINGTKFWLGLHPAPKNFVDLEVRHLDHLINWLSVADIMVTVDTGPMHVAAAIGVPIVALGQSSSPELHLSDQRDYVTIWPDGLECLNCQKNDCPIDFYVPPCQKFDPLKIADTVNRRLGTKYSEDISAVIPIYKPDPAVLNRCLESVLPQVHEIVVCAEGNSLVPALALQHPKIKYVRTNKRGIGYSRNINHGVRHSHGKWIVAMNDDCFLKPDAVEKMMEVARKDTKVGLVSNLLRYPDGTIYHSGKVRSPGVMGWGHVNHRQTYPAFFEPVELENCCGCCVLIPRKVFYEIGAFDEEYFLFSQDDDMALSVRQAGYKIMFTPHSEGIHMEHQSVAKIGKIAELVAYDNSVFNRNWNWYLKKNLQTVPGTFQ